MQSRKRARGYTILEVMIALTLITVGVSGVVAMQKVTTVANRDARNLAVANQITRTWIDRLRTDAIAWNYPSPSMPGGSDLATDTLWLRQVESTQDWFQPATDANRGGPAFDLHGNDVSNVGSDDPVFFCTNLRLRWLYGPGSPPLLIRAEVRVFWLREGGGGLPAGMTSFCDSAAAGDMATIGASTQNFHFVYATSAIKQHPH